MTTLRRFGVDFVCIGGVAAVMQGANYVTFDLDVCPDPDAANLDRLSAALRELDAHIRVEGVEHGFAFDHDAASLARARVWNLTTTCGDLDLCFLPAGTLGYEDLRRSATSMTLADHDVAVASIDDLIRSKEAANRDKDQLALPILRAMRDRLR